MHGRHVNRLFRSIVLKGDTEGEKYWWSKLINHSRSLMQGENEETGLKGENLISELEKNRTGLDPYDAYIYNTRADMIFNQLFQKTIEKRYLLKLKPLLESLKIWLHIFIEIK